MLAEGFESWYGFFNHREIFRAQYFAENSQYIRRVEGEIAGVLLDKSFDNLEGDLYVAVNSWISIAMSD